MSFPTQFCVLASFLMMSNMSQEHNNTELRPFEGMWLLSPSGNIACAKAINGELLIPYARGEEAKLAGHYFNRLIIGEKLFCRFEGFEPYTAGDLFPKIGPNCTLKGGWWLSEHIPKTIHDDISQISDALPEMSNCVWLLMPKAKVPAWAEEYFLKDFPNE